MRVWVSRITDGSQPPASEATIRQRNRSRSTLQATWAFAAFHPGQGTNGRDGRRDATDLQSDANRRRFRIPHRRMAAGAVQVIAAAHALRVERWKGQDYFVEGTGPASRSYSSSGLVSRARICSHFIRSSGSPPFDEPPRHALLALVPDRLAQQQVPDNHR